MPTSYQMPIITPQPAVIESVKEESKASNNNNSSSAGACSAPHDVVAALCTCFQHPHQKAMEIESIALQEYQMRAESERKNAAMLREQVCKLRKEKEALENELKKNKKQVKESKHNEHLAELDMELYQEDVEQDFEYFEDKLSVTQEEVGILQDKCAKLKKSLVQALNDSAEYQQRAEYAEQQLRESRGFPKAPRRPSRFHYDRKVRELPKPDNRFGLHFTRSPMERVNAKIAVGDFVLLDPKTKKEREEDVFWLGKVLYIGAQKGSLTVDYYILSKSTRAVYERSEEGRDHGVSVARNSVLAFSVGLPDIINVQDAHKLKMLVAANRV
jgi:hypothetical protein